MGLVLMFVPRMAEQRTVWDSQNSTLVDKPFSFVVVLDTESETMSVTPATGHVKPELKRGTEFTISGYSGEGQVSLKAVDPAGIVLIDEQLGPDDWFYYPSDWVEQPISESSGIMVPTKNFLIAHEKGTYELLIQSLAGSPGFTILVNGYTQYPIWAWQELWGLGTSLPWFIIGALLIVSSISRALRLPRGGAGFLLVLLAVITPVALLFQDFHLWYWRASFPVLCIVSMIFAFVGAFWIGRAYTPISRASSVLKVLSGFLITLAGAASLLQLLLIPASMNYALPIPPDSYNGDYMGLGLHIIAFQVNIVGWFVAGLFSGFSWGRGEN